MVENHSLRGVGAAEPIWWKIKAFEGWVQQSQYRGKATPRRDGYSGTNMVENQSLRGVGVAESMWWKI